MWGVEKGILAIVGSKSDWARFGIKLGPAHSRYSTGLTNKKTQGVHPTCGGLIRGILWETRRRQSKLRGRELMKAMVTDGDKKERNLLGIATITSTLNTLQQLNLLN